MKEDQSENYIWLICTEGTNYCGVEITDLGHWKMEKMIYLLTNAIFLHPVKKRLVKQPVNATFEERYFLKALNITWKE